MKSEYIGGQRIAINGRPPRGGRGLKFGVLDLALIVQLSPSSRRAWIEIPPLINSLTIVVVALLAEGVD